MRALRGFGAARVLLRAASLTYLTLLSLVPLLAVAMRALEALGLLDLRTLVQRFIVGSLAVGARGPIMAQLDSLLGSAGKRAATTVGFILLLGSALLLLRNIEQAFSDLWGLRRTRHIGKQIATYVGVLLAGPVALGASLALTAAIRGFGLLGPLGSILPAVITVAAFSLLYLIAPAAPVRVRAALFAGAVAGLTWELAKVLYASYAARALRTDLVYGPLGALPLFLIWLYVSWLIALFGARLAYAVQHPYGLLLESDDEEGARALELCALRLAVECGHGPLKMRAAAEALRVPESLVRSAADKLEDAGILRVSGRRLELARPADRVALGEVLLAVRTRSRRPDAGGDPTAEYLRARLLEADQEACATLSGETVADAAGLHDGAAPGVAKA